MAVRTTKPKAKSTSSNESVVNSVVSTSVDTTLGTINPSSYIKTFSLNKYYTPSITDFRLGLIYDYKFLDEWVTRMLTDQDLTPVDGHCEYMNIMYNLEVMKKNTYRIKYLDRSDIELLDFKYTSSDGTTDIYHKSNLRLEHVPSKCIVRLMVDDNYVFRGKLLNLTELKDVLLYLTSTMTERRMSLIENIVKS